MSAEIAATQTKKIGGHRAMLPDFRLQWAHLDLNQGPAGYESDALTD